MANLLCFWLHFVILEVNIFPWLGIFFHRLYERKRILNILFTFFRNFISKCQLVFMLAFPCCFIFMISVLLLNGRICPVLSADMLSFLFLLLLEPVCLMPPQKWHMETAMRLFLKQTKLASGFIWKVFLILNSFNINLNPIPYMYGPWPFHQTHLTKETFESSLVIHANSIYR